MELKELKKNYEMLAKKYKLPNFRELNENFEIDKIDKERGVLLKAIRKVMMEKIISSLGFIEMFLNQINVPRMYYAYIKSMTQDDKKIIEKIYTAFSELTLVSLETEIDYNEKKEAELINKILKVWNGMKPEFGEIISGIRNSKFDIVKKERSYFG